MEKALTKSDFAKEAMRRKRAAEGVLPFTEYTHPNWETGKHHKIVCDALEKVADGTIDRLMIFAPPRHSKSELASRRFPAWYLGKHPDRQIITASYGDILAADIGADVRDIVRDPWYQNIFPGTHLRADTKAAGRWRTEEGGIYIATGIGGAITGRGAHIFIVDDPIKNREDADSKRKRDIAWRWYMGVAHMRLMPGGAIVLMMCMTGDTPVLMSSGEQKNLRDIKRGDKIATYKNGKLVESTVLNWANKGPDLVYRIKTSSGITVKANERHPFLIERKGGPEWVRLKNLRVGDGILRATGENGAGLSVAWTAAKIRQNAKECATPTTIRNAGRTGLDHHRSMLGLGAAPGSNIVTESLLKSMIGFSRSKKACAQFAEALRERMYALTGEINCALTIATQQVGFAGSCATTAIWPSVTEKPKQRCEPPPSISDFAPDRIVEIAKAGTEDVFDIQVANTENFIANGLVVHNTRWHEDDLAARALGVDNWTVIKLKGIADEHTDHETALWPGWFPIQSMRRIRKTMAEGGRLREWEAQYQQEPTPDSGTYIKREWFNERYSVIPKNARIYMASDFAVTAEDEGQDPDFTEHGVFAIDEESKIYPIAWWSGRTPADIWIDKLLEMAEHHKPMCWFGEAGMIRRALESIIEKRCRERKIFFRKEWIPSINDKAVRGRAFQARSSSGMVVFPNAEEWAEAVIEQCVGFPGAAKDDKFDVMSLMCSVVDKAHPAIQLRPPEIKPRRDGYKRVKRDRRGKRNWKVA